MDAKPVSILVIDADAASRNYLSAMLTKSGFTILTAALGKEGLISAWRDLPKVIIFDPILPDLTGLELVNRLRQDRRTSKVMLIAIGSQEAPAEVRDLVNAGCSEYLVKSSNTLQKLQSLLERFSIDGKITPVKQGRIIAFLSAKGGTGTSSLCANIAMCMASDKQDQRVAVMDLVLPIGSIAHIVGYKENLNLASAATQDPEKLTVAYFKENLPRIPGWFFHLMAGAPDPESANRLSGEMIDEIFQSIVASYDYIFVDLGRSLSRISVPIIQKAAMIVLVLSTDLATAELTLTIWDYLKSLGVDPLRMFPIQNRAIGLEGLTRTELEKMLGLPITVTIPYMGDNFTVANNRHEPIATRIYNDAVAILLHQVATEILEKDKHQVH